VTGGWKKFHNKLVILAKWSRHVACVGEKRDAYRVLMGKPEGNTPFGIMRRK